MKSDMAGRLWVDNATRIWPAMSSHHLDSLVAVDYRNTRGSVPGKAATTISENDLQKAMLI